MIFRLIYAINRPIYDTRLLIVIILLCKMFVVQLHMLKCLCGMRDDFLNFS